MVRCLTSIYIRLLVILLSLNFTRFDFAHTNHDMFAHLRHEMHFRVLMRDYERLFIPFSNLYFMLMTFLSFNFAHLISAQILTPCELKCK